VNLTNWPPAAVFVIGGITILIIGALLYYRFGIADDGRLRQLQQAPGINLTYPDGKLLDTQTVGSADTIGAYRLYAYGTDASADQILAYFDAQLGQLGYAPVAPTPDFVFTTQQDRLLRQYQNNGFAYRLYLAPLPQRVGGNMVNSGYANILYAKLND